TTRAHSASARAPLPPPARLALGSVANAQPPFFPAVPREHIAHPQMTAQECSKLTQEGVACQVTQGVVVVLEEIQVDHPERAVPSVPADALDFGAKDLLEMPPVVQPGQRISNRQLRQLGPQR